MAPRALKPRDRRAKLVQEVGKRGGARVEELALLFDTSRETIRRDLNTLSEAGKLRKVHGAAKPPGLSVEGSFQQRLSENSAAKLEIARLALDLVAPGDTIFVDTGSTTLFFSQQLSQVENLRVITNSAAIADVVAKGNETAAVYLIGGRYDAGNREAYGPQAIAQIGSFYARRTFLTVASLDAHAGVADVNIDEADVAKAMIARSEELVILADSTKFGPSGPYTVSALDDISYLVTERRPDKSLMNGLRSSGVKVICGGGRRVGVEKAGVSRASRQ